MIMIIIQVGCQQFTWSQVFEQVHSVKFIVSSTSRTLVSRKLNRSLKVIIGVYLAAIRLKRGSPPTEIARSVPDK